MVSFANFVKSMPSSLSELKVIPSFCFAFKIPDDVTATSIQHEFNTENQYKCDPFDAIITGHCVFRWVLHGFVIKVQ